MKKADHQRIDALELWCWRRLLRVPWTTGRSNQSILKEISLEYSFEGLILKLKLQYFGHLMQRTAWEDWRPEEKGMPEDEIVEKTERLIWLTVFHVEVFCFSCLLSAWCLLSVYLWFYLNIAKSLQLCPTLYDPMDCSPPGSSVHGILQARILEWVAISFSRGIFLTQGLNLHL